MAHRRSPLLAVVGDGFAALAALDAHRGAATAGSVLRASVLGGGVIPNSRDLARKRKSVVWETCFPLAHRRTVSTLRSAAMARLRWFRLVMVRIVPAPIAAVNGRVAGIARKFIGQKR